MHGWNLTLAAVALAAVGGAAPARADADCRVQGDLAAQVLRCTEIIAATPERRDRAIAYLYRCQAHDMLGRHDRALEDCLTSADLAPDDSSTFNSLNIVYRNLGRLQESLDAASTAIRLRPDQGAAFAGRASTLCRMKRFDESLQDRLKAVELGYLDASRVQQILKERGFYAGEIDGRMGESSRSALRAWTESGC